jgi:type I restriction enzyme R subunit
LTVIDAGDWAGFRNRLTRQVRWEAVDEPVSYTAAQLDRAVVADDQIRTVITTFRDKLFTEIFPGRTTVPKTLIFAKDDSHAENLSKSKTCILSATNESRQVCLIFSIPR